MKYVLSEANQNTFVLFDFLNEELNPKHLDWIHRILVRENRDDALILTGKRPLADGKSPILQMLVFGQDKTFGEFCGNGALSCAAYLFDHYHGNESFTLKTSSKTAPVLKKEKTHYVVELPLAKSNLNEKFISRKIPGFNYMEILEPHLLIEQDLDDDQLHTIGRTLNERRDLFPLGINVNAWQRLKMDIIFVKTYERGVQRLTKSCGSGSACCAAFFRQQGNVRVDTRGGSLEVYIGKENILLKGQASYEKISL